MLDHKKWSTYEIQTHVRKSPSMHLGVTTLQKKKFYSNLEAEDKRTSFDLNTYARKVRV